MKSLVLAFALLVYPVYVHGAPSKQELSLKVIQDFVIPAHEKLAKNSKLQADIWSNTCDSGELKSIYHQTADAWASVQHIKTGPITQFKRRDRLYYWPDTQNAVSQGLNDLLAKKDKTILNLREFALTNVATQGFPAMERLIYTDLVDNDFSCLLGKIIADNISQIAQDTFQDWGTTLDYVKSAKPHPVYFTTMDDLANRLFSDLISGFQLISDQKIGLSLGSSIEKSSGKNAEAWLSKRSTRYIQQNALGLMAMAKTFIGFLPADEAKKLQIQFSLFARAANNLPLSIKEAVSDRSDRAKLEKFLKVNQTTQDLLLEILSTNLNLPIESIKLQSDKN